MSDFTFSFGKSSGPRVDDTPFVLGLMADLSGARAEPLETAPGRNFLEIDVDNFDARLRAAAPRVAFAVPNAVTGEGEIEVDVTFRDLESFSPAYVASKVEVLTKLCTARRQLVSMRSRPGASTGGTPRELLAQALDDPALVDALAGAAPAEATPEPAPAQETPEPQEGGPLSDLDKLMGKEVGSAPAPPPQQASPLAGLFKQASADTPQISDEVVATIGGLVDRLDAAVARQLDLILHHAAYQTLEGTWRGLNFVLENVDTDEDVKIRVLNISKAELAAMLEAGGLLGENPLVSKLRGDPYACLVGDYQFDHSPPDLALLSRLGMAAVALGLPFIGGAASSLFGLGSWGELDARVDTLQRLAKDEYAGWRQLVDSVVAEHLLLTMPRFLARLPYGRKTNPAEGITYEEGARVDEPATFTWSNAAWAMAAVIGRAASIDGWQASLTPGGEDCQTDGLPCYHFTNKDGDTELMSPTEVRMTVDFGVLLSKTGLAPLLHLKNTDRAVFVRVPTLRSRG